MSIQYYLPSKRDHVITVATPVPLCMNHTDRIHWATQMAYS